MSQTEVVTVLKVETGNSENTIKSIKKEITDLKKALEGAEIGSESFEKASKDLADAQQRLKSVMDSTKKTVSAAEGSYDALVATMAKLKKEWRSTADEAKRNEIGKQIEAINTELKELDATLGNHQRNVGNYKGDIIEAYQEIQGEVKKTNGVLAGSAKPIDKASEAAFDYGKAWSEVQKSTEQTRAKFESVQKLTSGLASGFAAVQGAAALLGGENENLQKTFVKVQAAMAIAQGIGGLKDLIEGFSQAKTAFMGATMGLEAMAAESTVATAAMNGTTVATNTATVATNNFKRALIATGIGAIVVLIGTLIANLDKLAKALGFVEEEQEEVNEEIEKSIEREKERKKTVNDSVGSILGKYKLLQRQWKELSSTEEKNEWINKNKQAFEDLGISINGVNAAQKVFVENSEAVIKAIKDQAKARAMAKLYEEAIAQQYTAEQELEDAQQTAEKKYYNGYKPSDDEAEKAGLVSSDYGTRLEENSEFEQWWYDKGSYDVVPTDWVDYSGARKLQNEYTRPFQQSVDAINGEVAKLEEAFIDAEQTAAASAAAVQELGIDYTPTGSSGSGSSGSGSTDTDETLERIKEIQKRAEEYLEEQRLALIDTKEEELAELKLVYDKEVALFQSKEQDISQLDEEYKQKRLEIEKKYNEQLREETLNNLDTQLSTIENSTAIQERNIERNFSERALALDTDTKSILPSIKEEDNIAPIQLEIEKVEQLRDIRRQAFDEQMAQIQTVLDSGLLTAEQQAELQAQYAAIQQEKVQVTADATAEINTLNKQLVKQQQADNRQLAQNITTTFTSALNAASSILSAVQEGIDTTNKEGFEKNKKLQIANATIGMLVGITNAIAGLFTTKSGPWDIALAAIQAGAIATTGAIQIANIKKQTFDGSGGNTGNLNGSVGVSPNISMADMIPINYTKDVLTDTETAEINKGNRIYVVESDVTETQENVKVKESNSSF